MQCFNLKEVYKKHNGKISYKWESYLDIYDKIFAEFKNREINILEIGVQNGGSLEIWAKYFAKAKNVIGCDINDRCSQLNYQDGRIKIVIGDASQISTAEKVKEIVQNKGLDIVIDDGSHKSSDIIRTFVNFFPLLNYGGIYIIEDLCCGYWKNFEGGLFNYYSSVNFFKTLIDVVNYEHWRLNKPRSWILSKFEEKYGFKVDDQDLATIHSIEFYNSMCVIRKARPERNLIGLRIVVGSESPFGRTREFKKRDKTSVRDIYAEVENIESLPRTFREYEAEIVRLQNQITKINDISNQ